MPAYAGRSWALSLLIGGSYIPVAGLKTRSMTVNNTNVDVTTADSQGRWRELLGGAGIQSLDVDIAGLYQNDAGAKALFAASTQSSLVTMRLVTQGIQIDMSAFVDQYKSDGPFNDAQTFEAKLLSSGQPTITLS